MPGSFQFDSVFLSDTLISQGQASLGAGVGIDNPALNTMQAARFHFNDNDVSIAAVFMTAGQQANFDVDFGQAGGIDPLNTEVWIVDETGAIVAQNDTAVGLDNGSTSTADPRIAFTAATTGLYYVVIAHAANAYINNTFGFSNTGGDSGDFLLNVSFSGLAARSTGTTGDDGTFLTMVQRRHDALSGNDNVYADAVSTIIDGNDGNDYLQGNIGNDTLIGSDGDDSLYGGSGNDAMLGGNGQDYMTGDIGSDRIHGGGGSYDTLDGGANNDLLFGEAGTDYMYDGAGNDEAHGGADGDYFYSSTGTDLLDGGLGFDTLYLFNSTTNTKVDLAVLGPQNTGSLGIDTILNFEYIYGGAFNDRLYGDGQSNYLAGHSSSTGTGNDTLDGRGGADNLTGHDGNDVLIGGADFDQLTGGLGKDSYTGGAGQDYHYFNTAAESPFLLADKITDFSHAQGDRIGLQNVYSGTLVFVGAGPFTAANEVRAVTSGTLQVVYVNLDADLTTSEMKIVVDTPVALLGSDFFL
jgi:Ca2+-binding RTX toxin-like protein